MNKILNHILEATNAQESGSGYKGICPSHVDRTPSLSVDYRDSRILLKCWAGCDTRDIVSKLGLQMEDLTVDVSELINDVWAAVIQHDPYLKTVHSIALEQRVGFNNPQFTRGYISVDSFTGKKVKEALFELFTIDELKQVPGVFDANGMLLRLPEGILIPVRDRWGRITGLQIRRDDGKPKYWTPKGSKLGVHCPPGSSTLNNKVVRVTEGPLKADVSQRLSQVSTVGTTGASNWRDVPELLHQLGATEVLVAFDADYQTNEGVRTALKGLVNKLKSDGFRVGIETWDGTKAKGIDDALVLQVPISTTYDIDVFISSLNNGSNFRSNYNVDTGTVEVIRASTVTPKKTTWLWKNWLPVGSVTIMDGDPSLGKSQITLDLAAHVTTGQPMPDSDDMINGPVIILSAEDSVERTTVPRLIAAGADLSKIDFFQYVLKGEQRLLPSLPHDIDKLEEMIIGRSAKLVIIDPFFAFLDSSINSFSDQDIRKVMDRLSRVAERTQSAILLLRHLNKGGNNNPQYRGGGSIGIIAAVRTGWLVAKNPYLPPLEAGGVLTMTKNNLGPYPNSLSYKIEQAIVDDIPTSHIVWTGTSDLVARDVVAVQQSDQSEADKRMGWLATLIHDKKEISANDLRIECEKAGYSYMKLLKLSANFLSQYGIVKESNNVWRSNNVAQAETSTVKAS